MLFNNRLSGTLPDDWYLPMAAIELANNSFSGTIPANWTMPNLLYLSLSYNNLTGRWRWEVGAAEGESTSSIFKCNSAWMRALSEDNSCWLCPLFYSIVQAPCLVGTLPHLL